MSQNLLLWRTILTLIMPVIPQFTVLLGGKQKCMVNQGHSKSGESLHNMFYCKTRYRGNTKRHVISRDTINRGIIHYCNCIVLKVQWWFLFFVFLVHKTVLLPSKLSKRKEGKDLAHIPLNNNSNNNNDKRVLVNLNQL